MSPQLVLVGPPGAGKSAVGRLVADRLGLPFRDTDEDVEALAGRSVSDIFIEDGESTFRDLERRAVVTALGEHDGVLALGGGAILDDRTRAALRGLAVVFLDVGLTDAAKRVGLDQSRPLLLGRPRAQWQHLMTARRPLYEEVATRTVLTDGRSPQDVADEIVAGPEEAAP